MKAYLAHVKEGGWIEPDHQDAAAVDSLNRAIDDAFSAGAVGGDRSKARSALASGSTTIDGLDFTIFIGNQLVDGAGLLTASTATILRNFAAGSERGAEAVKAAEGLLKETPNADKDKQVKKLDDQIKTTLKHI